jgi:hypothetical protein
MLMRAESGLSGRRRMEGSREHGSRDGGFVLHGRVKGARWQGLARFGRVWRARAGRDARAGGWIVSAHNWSSLLLAVVRVWDHVCASRGVECGFFAGF